MSTPLDRLGPRSVLGALSAAFLGDPASWVVLLIPAPWFLVDGVFYAVQNGAPPGRAVGISALGVATGLAVLALLLWVVLPLLRRLVAVRSVVVLLLCYAAGGVAQAAVLVAGTTSSVEPMWSRWLWLSLSYAVNAMIWLASAAILVSWGHRMREQRVELETEYERQILTRAKDTQALVDADQQLAQVRVSTHQAVSEIRSRLHPEMTVNELSACVDVIDDVVAGVVRPVSHDLARMATEAPPVAAEPLWRGWRQMVPALIRNWPIAKPFQPALVGLLCLPMVMVAELVHLPHRLDEASLLAIGVLSAHLVLLVAAERILGPRLGGLPARVGVAVVFTVYLVLYLIGLSALLVAFWGGFPAPLEAFLVPPLLAMVAGWISAAAHVQDIENAAAQTVIRRTNWEVRHTRQRLWAQRRRLAMALHGRVQANLTAASLMLGIVRDQMLAGEPLDQNSVQRVGSTLALADMIDATSAVSPAKQLALVTGVWDGVLSVALDLRPGAEELLNGSRDLTDACVEVIRELLLNSVRHSGATKAAVVVGADSEQLLCIRVSELAVAREPMGSVGGPGMGRSLIDSLAVDWAESDGDHGRITVAMLAAGAVHTAAGNARARLFEVDDLT